MPESILTRSGYLMSHQLDGKDISHLFKYENELFGEIVKKHPELSLVFTLLPNLDDWTLDEIEGLNVSFKDISAEALLQLDINFLKDLDELKFKMRYCTASQYLRYW